MKRIVTLAASAAAIALAAPSQAALIPNGTFALSGTSSPSVTFGSPTSSVVSTNQGAVGYSATGGFSAITNALLNGAITFSSTQGVTLANPVASYFTFSSGGVDYTFNVASVLTRTFADTPGTSQSASLYLLGTTLASGFDATESSLTLGLTSTGGSAFSSSATFSIPAAGAVPEPATWAMFAGAFGLIGAGLRRRRPAVTFA